MTALATAGIDLAMVRERHARSLTPERDRGGASDTG
jgi:hypothetical protein